MSLGDVKSDEIGSGARYNDGKPQYHLVPLEALADCAKVFEYGAKKYAEWNWLKGMPWSSPYDSLLRHMEAFWRGEDIDPESGESHLGHAMCNLVMLSVYAKRYKEGDDRPGYLLARKPGDSGSGSPLPPNGPFYDHTHGPESDPGNCFKYFFYQDIPLEYSPIWQFHSRSSPAYIPTPQEQAERTYRVH